MNACITGFCNQPNFEMCNFEARMSNGETAKIDWLKAKFLHDTNGFFVACVEGVQINGFNAAGRGKDFTNITITDVQVNSPYIVLNPQFKVDRLIVTDNNEKYEATNLSKLNFFETLNKGV